MPRNELTEHGKECVRKYVEQRKQEHRDAVAKAHQTANNLLHAFDVAHCDHDLKFEGGIERVATTCTKCGFTWFD